MATVRGITVQRALQIEGNTIVSGTVDQTSRHLILTKGDGSQVDAGIVKPEAPVVPAFPKPYEFWPVGTLFFNTNSANPNVLLGGGTWERYAQGRVVVGLNESDADFNTPGLSGGDKRVTLSNGQMPFHNHGGATGGRNADHTHVYQTINAYAQGASGNGLNYARTTGSYNTGGESNDHAHGIGYDGNNESHPNLQPYITTYIWRRTA